MSNTYSVRQILNLFGSAVSREAVTQAEKNGAIPEASRELRGSIKARFWSTASLPLIGERYGFLKRPEKPMVACVFAAKGGSFKTSLCLHLSRIAALHNIKTCVVGLDFQCDVSTSLGFYSWDDVEDLETALTNISRTYGLELVYSGKASVRDVVHETDIPTLFLIPETGALASLDRALGTIDWLRTSIVEPLKVLGFDLIVFDTPPNWGNLISNAIAASDVLISTLECQVSQFRNLPVFQELAREFMRELPIPPKHIFVPTRFSPTRKLSAEIRAWYLANVPNVTHSVMRECTSGAEAIANQISILEHAPTSLPAVEMRELLREIWHRMGAETRAATDEAA